MHAAEITKKDLLLLYRDRRTLFVLVALPLAFISILGFSTGQLFSQGQKARTYKVAIVDVAKTPLSEKLNTKLSALKALDLSDLPDLQSARQQLAEDKVDVLLFIPKDYGERVEALELWELFEIEQGRLQSGLASLGIQVEAGSFLANASELVQALVFSFVVQTIPETVLDKDPKLKTQILRAKVASRKRLEAQLEELESAAHPAEGGAKPSMFTNVVYQILVPSYTVMFVFFIVTFMSRSFIAEREMGTLARLKLAPISRTGLLLGKTVPFLVISLVQTLLLFAAGKVLFGMSWGAEPWLLLPVMFFTSLSATALGLMVSTVVRTESQVSAYGNFLVLTMAGISGCMMPRAWQPELMQQVGLVTPHAWALIAYDQLLSRTTAPDLSVVLKSCQVLLCFALSFFAIGWWRFRELE
jgi:ABC-2 type transport system permease protein